jgi:hypothetical protein
MAPYREWFDARFDRVQAHLKTMLGDQQHKPARKRSPRQSKEEPS